MRTGSNDPGASALNNAVKIIAAEDLAVYHAKTQACTLHDGQGSPLQHQSIPGYTRNGELSCHGVEDIRHVFHLMGEASIPCCAVGEAALIYYGAKRVMTDWHICVPSEFLKKATALLRCHSQIYRLSGPSSLSRPSGLEHFFPRFEICSTSVSFTLLSSKAANMKPSVDTIDHSREGLPYPKLHIYAQSLLDTLNLVDLDDLIDGMNLTLEWGEANLNLKDHVDADWGRWKTYLVHGGEAGEEHIPKWCSKPPERYDIWQQTTSLKAKENRQGWKFSPSRKTRFC